MNSGVPDLFKIRPATAADASQLHELHTRSVQELCQQHYTQTQITAWLQGRTPEGYQPGIEQGEIFVAEAEGRIIGFGHATVGTVVAIFVSPDWVRHGIGSSLLAHGLERARHNPEGAVQLEATLNAQEFYGRKGFLTIEQRSVRRNNIFLPVVLMEWRPEI